MQTTVNKQVVICTGIKQQEHVKDITLFCLPLTDWMETENNQISSPLKIFRMQGISYLYKR